MSDGSTRLPVIGPGHTYGSVTEKISAIVLERRTSKGWFLGFAISFALLEIDPRVYEAMRPLLRSP